MSGQHPEEILRAKRKKSLPGKGVLERDMRNSK